MLWYSACSTGANPWFNRNSLFLTSYFSFGFRWTCPSLLRKQCKCLSLQQVCISNQLSEVPVPPKKSPLVSFPHLYITCTLSTFAIAMEADACTLVPLVQCRIAKTAAVTIGSSPLNTSHCSSIRYPVCWESPPSHWKGGRDGGHQLVPYLVGFRSVVVPKGRSLPTNSSRELGITSWVLCLLA